VKRKELREVTKSKRSEQRAQGAERRGRIPD